MIRRKYRQIRPFSGARPWPSRPASGTQAGTSGWTATTCNTPTCLKRHRPGCLVPGTPAPPGILSLCSFILSYGPAGSEQVPFRTAGGPGSRRRCCGGPLPECIGVYIVGVVGKGLHVLAQRLLVLLPCVELVADVLDLLGPLLVWLHLLPGYPFGLLLPPLLHLLVLGLSILQEIDDLPLGVLEGQVEGRLAFRLVPEVGPLLDQLLHQREVALLCGQVKQGVAIGVPGVYVHSLIEQHLVELLLGCVDGDDDGGDVGARGVPPGVGPPLEQQLGRLLLATPDRPVEWLAVDGDLLEVGPPLEQELHDVYVAVVAGQVQRRYLPLLCLPRRTVQLAHKVLYQRQGPVLDRCEEGSVPLLVPDLVVSPQSLYQKPHNIAVAPCAGEVKGDLALGLLEGVKDVLDLLVLGEDGLLPQLYPLLQVDHVELELGQLLLGDSCHKLLVELGDSLVLLHLPRVHQSNQQIMIVQ